MIERKFENDFNSWVYLFLSFVYNVIRVGRLIVVLDTSIKFTVFGKALGR